MNGIVPLPISKVHGNNLSFQPLQIEQKPCLGLLCQLASLYAMVFYGCDHCRMQTLLLPVATTTFKSRPAWDLVSSLVVSTFWVQPIDPHKRGKH